MPSLTLRAVAVGGVSVTVKVARNPASPSHITAAAHNAIHLLWRMS
jgi:hypothetical protein